MANVTTPTSAQSQKNGFSSLQNFNDAMPHATETEVVSKAEVDDDALIAGLLGGDGIENDALGKLENDFEAGALGGEKADDAVDYEDISDDDLPDEEDAPDEKPGDFQLTNGHGGEQDSGDLDADLFGDGEANGEFQGGDDFDDLFGDGEGMGDDYGMPDASETKPAIHLNGASVKETSTQQQPSYEDNDGMFGDDDSFAPEESTVAPQLDQPDEDDPDPAAREQARMFREARERVERLRMGGLDPDAVITGPVSSTDQELVDEFFANYDGDETPYLGQLFFKRRAHYLKKAPLKLPTKAQPTRPILDLEADQERAFKLTSAPKSRKRTNEEADPDVGLYFAQLDEKADQNSDDQIDIVSLHDEEQIGGVSLGDLRVLCEDWDSFSVKSVGSEMMNMTNGFDEPNLKRRRVAYDGLFESITRDDYPLFDDPETLTAKLAKTIPLDLNDSHLLLDFPQPAARDQSAQNTFGRRRELGGVSSAIHKKFNFSNDEEYERLVKENSIRGAVGNIPIEHSGPAKRLQYPYYKTTLSHREQRNFHRPALQFQKDTRVNIDRKLEHRKIKDMRKLATAQAFAQTNDLTLADNSSMMLLEYSEELPLMMNNFGMNSRIINYYRRKDEHDKFRPKEDVGEPRILQEKDQSPFAKFGFVDAGQTMPSIHNNLHRAPIFRHDPRSSDFLVVRRQTGVYGTSYHLRNVENLHVVGQQFPSAEVPGTHGRKVTSTQKARMKMIAFRIYHKKLKTRGRHPYVPHSVITTHFPGSDVAQNRSKMRELMQYNKDHGSWEPKVGDDKFLDMELLRAEIKPEDICLIDSMQVGARQLQDAGFSQEKIDNDKDDAAENQSLDAQLVSWRATKNFLAACGDNAMIALHGEGDPTGRGEAFSFVKISMKGGFQPLGASANDKIRGAGKVDASGHKYNVRDQEDAYHSAIRHIWDAQAHSLGSSETPDLDVEMDDNIDARIERNNSVRATPKSEVAGTPRSYFPQQSEIDDGMSHVSGSRVSASDRQMGGDRQLKVIRRKKDEYGEIIEEIDYIDDPIVARQYMKKHDSKLRARYEEKMRFGVASGGASSAMTPNGNLTADERKAVEDELIRLQKNKDRRKIREAQKAAKAALRDGTVGENGIVPGQTARKCANCGQLGHIKTNKKLCPMLNGQWKDGVPPGAQVGPSSMAPPNTPGGGAEASGSQRQGPALSSSFNF